MSICVLGADGFIGRNLVKDLGVRGYGRRDVDLLDSKAVDVFFDSHTFDVVVHCAAVGGSRLKKDDADVFFKNVKMFENVARHATKFKRLVWFSSGAAIHTPDSPYGFSKVVCEKLAGLVPNCQVFRLYGCYGIDEPQTRFISSCIRGITHIEENRYFDFFWVGDIPKVITNFTKCDGKVRDLVYKTKWKLFDVAKMNKAKAVSLSRDGGPSYIGEFDEEIGHAIDIFDRHPVMCPEEKSIAHDGI
jgi:nucleoside-diphosphate-sugar epimerase